MSAAPTLIIAGKKYVVIPAAKYKELIASKKPCRAKRQPKLSAEDRDDLAAIRDRRNDPTISSAEMKARLGL